MNCFVIRSKVETIGNYCHGELASTIRIRANLGGERHGVSNIRALYNDKSAYSSKEVPCSLTYVTSNPKIRTCPV